MHKLLGVFLFALSCAAFAQQTINGGNIKDGTVTQPKLAAITATGGTSGRAIGAHLADSISVKDFGAVGDGSTPDTAAFQAALDAPGKNVYVPRSSACYVVDQVTLGDDNKVIYGDGAQLCMSPLSLNPMFNLGAHSNIEIYGLRLTGNRSTQTSASSGSNAIQSSNGSARIRLHDLYIDGWTRHGISLDGVTNAIVSDNYVTGSYYGAGILISPTNVSSEVTVSDNQIVDVQMAGVHSFAGVDNFVISGNVVNGTGQGSGSLLAGEVADCITAYTESPAGISISVVGNVCKRSQNNGIHVGGDSVTVSSNIVIDPLLYGILVARAPNALPDDAARCVVADNTVRNTSSVDTTKPGISIRDCAYVTATGNIVDTSYSGIELYGFAATSGVQSAQVSGNTLRNTTVGVWLKKHVSDSSVVSNTIDTATVGVQVDDFVDGGGSSPSFYTLIQGNTFSGVSGDSVLETAGSDFTKVGCNFSGNGAAGTYTLVGANSKLLCSVNTTAAALSNQTIGNTNTASLLDTLFTVQDDGDATKQLRFQLSGVTTGMTRTLTAPNQSGTLALLNGGSAQNFSGINQYTGTNSYNALVTLGSTTPATGVTGELAFLKITASGTAPGANYCKEEWVCGTNAGTAKRIAYCGTSNTPVTIIDNVGAAVTGC